jgi:alpha-galactosidase
LSRPLHRRTRSLTSRLVAVGLTLAGAVAAVPGQSAVAGTPEAGGTATSDLVATPPMGWNSWNKFGCDINEELIRETADAMVSSGMRDAGYSYVNLDDCWMAPQRDAQGRLQPDPDRFPHGLAALSAYVHGLGLKLGIYSTAGTGTCQRLPGSLGHEQVDAQTFADWGVDYLKYDHCFTEKAALPGLDRFTVRGAGGLDSTVEAESASVTRTGTAKVTTCSACSGGAQVVGAGRAAGTVGFTVTAPTTGSYDLDLRYVNPGDPRTAYYPTGYVSVDGRREENRLRFPQTTGAVPGTLTTSLDLTAGTHTIEVSNPFTDIALRRANFAAMRSALAATGRPIVLSINPNTQDGTSFADVSDLWRTTQDIKPLWHSTSWYRGVGDIIEENGKEYADAGPGHWNDPDMLEVGVDVPGFPGLSETEARTHFAMWTMMAAPLIAGADIRALSPASQSILTNPGLIRIDQDPRGIAGHKVRDDGATEVWVKPLVAGDRAVALYNSGTTPATVRASAAEAGSAAADRYRVEDLWTGKKSFSDGALTATVPAHGVAVFRVHPVGTP